MGGTNVKRTTTSAGPRRDARCRSPFRSIKIFVLCHSLLQLAQLLVSGYMKSSISTIERRYGLTSQKSGLLAAFNEVGNTVLIIFVSFFGSRVHRPRFIGGGALLACLASLMMAMPHFVSGRYIYTDISNTESSDNSSSLCQPSRPPSSLSSRNCQQLESPSQQMVYPMLLLGQLLLGIGAVPIQPFGISYIDDYASEKNSPLYLGILLAVTAIGPAFGFVTGSLMMDFYVDFDKLSKDEIDLDSKDLRWVGAWWLGFLVASCLLFLAALPYFFFPREMPKEDSADGQQSKANRNQQETDQLQNLSLLQFLKSFPYIVLRTLRSPVYILVVLAQVNLAALLSGLATFMAKFIEKQFTQTVPFSTMMIGAVGIPMAVLGTVLGGALMRRFQLSVRAASKLCTAAIMICMFSALPLLFIGCPTQKVAGIFPPSSDNLTCASGCSCSDEAFNPVCGSDGMEFMSPCLAGCSSMQTDAANKVLNYTECRCVSGSGYARPGTCGSGCSDRLLPFVVLLGLTAFVAAFSQTPSYMMILRTVPAEDKSFAVGVQYMLFRVLAFMPGPVLYGSVIDTTCIQWGVTCAKRTSCHYYNLNNFRHRFLGLQVAFVLGGLICFLATAIFLHRRGSRQDERPGENGGYKQVEDKPLEDFSSNQRDQNGIEAKT